MSNVQVAIRVRPLSTRETADGARIAVQVEDKIVRIKNMKLDGRPDVHGDSREKVMEFGFDYCYWSVDPEGPNHASQEEVFQDLGVSVLTGASEGYNVCLFAYGQTGSGKTYTMIGTPASVGLTPRICQGLFNTDGSFPEGQSSCRVEISFLEIYNERVRDLLRHSKQKKPTPLRVREHPEKGPYVQGLSQYVVSDYKQAVELLEMGIANRITAATHMHDASSRSHAIFSIQYTQAILDSNLPSEIVSKINLVDLAGSERADPNYCRDRITEGSNINKSLVTLGIVISALAQNSQMFSSCQSINSMASEGETSVVGSQSSSYSGGTRRQCFIPYRDSVLTWLLKDSLGGNSKTIMIATVSPSCSSYSETLSTLRYAAHARNIVNKPRVNEDANVKLIRELREEIDRLKSMLLSYKMLRGPSPSLSEDRDGSLSDIVLQNEIKVEQLTKDWSDHWRDKKELLEQYSVDINRDQAGFLIHSLLPHLIALDRDVLSTGVTFYHLREGVTKIGPQDQQEESQIGWKLIFSFFSPADAFLVCSCRDTVKCTSTWRFPLKSIVILVALLVLQGEARCEIVNHCGLVTLRPLPGSVCTVNGREVTEPCRLAQGAVITLGDVYKFRFNHPAEAAILRERRRVSQGVLSHSSSVLSSWMPLQSTEEGGTLERGEDGRGAVHRQRVEEQQRYVECLREEMQAEQRQAEQDLQREQAHLRQQQTDIQQWLLQEKQHLSANEIQTEESEVQTDQVFNDLDGGLTDTVMGHRKRVVQEELLRHHALRRAEYRVRRKRLHYQLERIARKRHLLEAKRVLQCLESALSPESSMSSEPDSPVKTTGSPDFLRRHSFSADLLSCLYPKHNPTFSHLLRRNKSLELSSSLWRSAGAQKWVSDDCLPLKRIRNRANTLPSRPSFKTQANPSETVKADLLGTDQANMAVSKRKLSFTKRNSVISKNEERQQTASSDLDRNEKARLTVHKLSTPYSPPSVSKLSSKGSKGLERIRSVFSHSAGPGIRTALSKLFRKPPPGFVGNKDRKPVSTSQFQGNKKGNIRRDAKTKQSPVKINLEPISPFKQKEQRSWQSEEALSKAVGEPSLQERMDNGKAEEGEDFSDCDSSFSLDSLSSAYASALAEQLKREESELSDNGNDSEPESINSQISQDSLVLESNSKVNKMRSNSKQVMSSHCYTLVNEKTEEKELKSLSSLGICAFDDMPAEAFWNIKGVFTAEAGNKNEPKMESVSQPQLKIEAAALLLDSKEKDGPLLLANSSHQFSRSSAKASENLLVLTDAWACPEPSDSPRAHSDSTAVSRLTPIHPVYSSYFHSSVDLSESLSGPETRPFHIHNSKDSENATLLQHKYCDSETDNSQAVGQPGDHRIIASIDGVTDTSTEFVYSEGCDLQECSEIVSGIKREVEESVTLEKSIMQKTDPNQEHLCSAPINAPSLICESDHFPPKRESGTFKSMETFSAVGDRESILSQSSDSGFLCRNNCFTTEGNTFNIESARREEQQTQESDLVDGIIAAVCCQSDSMSICETDTSNCHEKLKPLSNEVDEEYSDESEIKCSDRKTYPAKGVDSEDTEVSVKEGKILKIYSLDAVPKIQGSQASLGTQRDFQLKDLQVLSENPREPLNFPSISGCSLNVNKCTGSLVKDFSLSTILCNNRLDVPQYLAATRQEYDCGKTTGYLVRTVGKGYKLSEMTQCLKQGIRQKVYSLKVCKTLTTYYRYKHFKKKKKCKLGSCYTTSKYRRKKRADKQAPIPGNNIQNNEMHDSFSKEGCEEASAYIYQEKFAREKISPQSQHNHISSSELCEFGSAIFQSNEYLADIRKMNSNVSAKQSGLKSCKTCISTKSIDASVAKDFNEEPVGNREIVVVSQTSDIQGGNADLLEYLGNTEEWDHSPVDQISEAVKEQTKLTQKGFENLSNGQLSSKMGTVELKTQKRESISVEQVPVTLKGVDKSFLLLDEKTNPINSDSLTSTVCKEITGQDVVLDDSQKNALTQVQQSSPDRKTDMPSVQSENRSAVNCGAPLPNTKKHECSPMVITGDIQTVSHSNKCPDSLKLSSTANILITDVLKSHQVKTQPETDRAQHEIPSRCATAKCQSMSLSMHKIDSTRTSQRLETVSKPETKQNPEVHDTHSSTCLLENCQKYDLSRQGHFSKPAAQTVGNNLRNICTSAAGSPIGQLEENERNVCLLHSEDTCKSCLKICQSFQNGPDNGDYLDVLAEPKKQVLPSEPSLSIHVHPLSASGKVSDANLNSVNLNENSSSNCTNMNGQIRANCKLNVLEKQSCGEDAPQSVSSECLCLAHCQSETIGKEMSSFGSRKPHNSCELLDFTETSKTEQIWETPNATKEDGLGSFQRLYLKSESSRDESQSSCTVSTNPSTCAFQMQEYAVHQTKDFLQSYPSLPNGSTQLTFLTDNNCCMEGHSDGKPLFINIHTVNHDSYQQDSDISGMPNLMNCSFEDIHPSDKTTTLSPNFKPKQKQLQDITVSHSLTKSLKNGKKLSRFNAREKSASSSECSVNLSSEEKVIAELCSGKSLITQSRPGSRIQSKLEVSAKTKKACTDLPKDQSADSFMVSLPLIQNYESLKTPGQSFDQISSTLCTETKNKGMNKRDGEKGYQADDYVPGNLEKNAHVFKTGRNINDVSHYTQKHPKQHNSCLLPQETVLDLQNFQNKDTTIHFASCDVNPFLHPRQEVATQRHYKVFGSATDISNKTPVLDGGSNRVTRWCSVDNELNVQSSPFYSHLHTFANKQTLSSTLSSTEGHKEQDSSEYTSNPHLKVHIGTSNSSASAMSEHLDSSSCQIDEMMLMCPSEQFSGPMHKEYSVLTCNPSTQATVPSKTKKRMNCNRRSRPEIHRTSMGAEGKAVATTLASLQNMSLHLSQLIHNTSDLLGNIDAIDRTHFAVNNKASSSSNCCKRDSSTQTAIDIAIQTDGITKPVGSKNIQKEQQTKEALKPHEVNVIVKVIGTDVLSISSEKEDIALTLQERISKRKTAQERHSLPDLHLSSDSQSSPTKVDLQKVQTSASSLDIFQRCSHLNPQGNPVSSSDHIPEQVSSTNFGDSTVNGSPLQTTRLKTQTLTKDLAFHQTVKGVFSTDRASSPILTLEAGVNQIIERKSSHAMGNCQMVGLPELMNDQIWKHRNSQSPTVCRLQEPIFSYEKSDISDGRVQYDDLPARSCANISNSSVSLENVRNLNGVHSKDNVLQNGFNTVDRVKGQTLSIGFSVSEHPSMHPVTQDSRLSHLPSYSKIHQTSPTISSNEDIFDCKQEKPKNKQMYFLEKELSFDNHTLGNYNREAGDTGMGLRKLECLDILDRTVQSQEDIVSLVASECNTDILINTKPLMDEAEKECVRVPEDLPMHNKFTNWSGVNCWPPSSLSSSLNQLPLKTPTRQEMKGSHSDLGCSESLKTDSRMLSDNRMKEIERLRQEREQLMATVRLDMNPHQLTVELAEAKLHYGLGETDALLKLLKSGSFEEACGVPTKQQLYDRHRRSIEGLRQEREVRLQTCRRTRSLSPGKLNPEKWPELPVKAIELPSQQREYLQKLRQELVTSSRVAAHPRKTGACPSEIELLLQDYGRAREVAKAEIARARDRLRERTEQEKRRLQQRALSQLVKDDLRLRTRVSSSTLCTGSSLSLSSGPTSGYSSSNPVLLKEGHRPSGQLQISKTSVDEEGKTRGPSPGKALLNVDSPRPWMPGQDAHVEAAVNRSNPQFPSSTASCRRRRTSSLTFVSPVSPSYQDIAASTLACATAEIHSAGNGDLKNLLAGKASHGWRYQGRERGVQTFYKSSSSPSMHSFLGAVELQRPLPSLWCMIRDHSKAHLYNGSIHSTWTRPLDSSTELVYLLTDASGCHLTQPRDFCCISAESKQDVEWVLAVRSVCDKSFPPPSREAVRGELSPSAWLLQPSQREGREVVVVFYLLQVDLGAPALPRRLLSIVAKKQAAVIAELDAFFSL